MDFKIIKSKLFTPPKMTAPTNMLELVIGLPAEHIIQLMVPLIQKPLRSHQPRRETPTGIDFDIQAATAAAMKARDVPPHKTVRDPFIAFQIASINLHKAQEEYYAAAAEMLGPIKFVPATKFDDDLPEDPFVSLIETEQRRIEKLIRAAKCG